MLASSQVPVLRTHCRILRADLWGSFPYFFGGGGGGGGLTLGLRIAVGSLPGFLIKGPPWAGRF